MSVTFAPAAESDLWKDHFGDPYCAVLTAGEYVIADPALILTESDYEEWHKVATISEIQFGQYGGGHDGIIHSGRINSHPVTGFTVYGWSDEYKDVSGNVYESSSARKITHFLQYSLLSFSRSWGLRTLLITFLR